MKFILPILLALGILLTVPQTIAYQAIPTPTPSSTIKPSSPPIPPILQAIANCESGNRQLDENGNVLHGRVNKYDTGRFQINELYHAEEAKALGYDLETSEGNTNFALWLFQKEGTTPWLPSKSCWSK